MIAAGDEKGNDGAGARRWMRESKRQGACTSDTSALSERVTGMETHVVLDDNLRRHIRQLEAAATLGKLQLPHLVQVPSQASPNAEAQ